MTVKELIKELEKYPEDCPVLDMWGKQGIKTIRGPIRDYYSVTIEFCSLSYS